ncbi:putative exported protein [Rhizobium sp. UR51a]|jgi:putative membrane protein|uniref:DUF4142 domain-containing protein n=1 Tax=Agrobacterium pusense TaxID=648995 RepID=A0A6H0ZSW6_9HYPH|nr:DUF4142 domain-containing protein [Agrobacterium pusense]KIV66102.1 putative exported protein [Rhizobium sp. UR51a]QIX23932.1 DUF4142 domain-containing protein [Agrobacterium pusense]
MKPFHACCAALCLSMLMPAFSNAQSPADFTAEAASFNQFEVEASRLALKSAQDDATKMFANDIMRDHEKALVDLGDAAKKDGTSVPTDLSAEYAEKMRALETASQSEFDQAYLSTQVSVLEDAKTMFEAFIKTGIVGSLRAYAENQRGTVRTYNVRVQGLTNP